MRRASARLFDESRLPEPALNGSEHAFDSGNSAT